MSNGDEIILKHYIENTTNITEAVNKLNIALGTILTEL